MHTSQTGSLIAATAADADRLARVIRQSFADVARRFALTPANCPKHPSNCTPAWIRADIKRGVRYFLLTVDGETLGCVGVEAVSPEVCYLERLAVLPGRRGHGHGTRLVRHALAVAGTLGAKTAEIGIIATDIDLTRFYENLGFEPAGTKNFAYLPFAVAFMRILV